MSDTNRQLFLQKVSRRKFIFAIFFIGIILGRYCWEKISLQFSNPWNIIGVLSLAEYNPANNFVRFLVFVGLPLLILTIVYVLIPKKLKFSLFFRNHNANDTPPKIPFVRHNLATLLFIIFTIITALNFSRSSEFFLKLDTFHDGETLGTAASMMHGKIPYKDFIFIHGIYEDPLRSVVAFQLFGKSIGSVRALESINNIILYVCMAIFLVKIFRQNYWHYFTVFILLMWMQAGKFISLSRMGRDVTIYAFLLSALYLYDNLLKKENKNIGPSTIITIFTFSFIPIASLCYSIDRGLYLCIIYFFAMVIIFSILPQQKHIKRHFFIISLAGILSSVVLLGFLIKWNFLWFSDYAFSLIKYKGYLDGMIYPIKKTLYLIPCIIIAANIYWVGLRFFSVLSLSKTRLSTTIQQFLRVYFIEIIVVTASILIFSSALSRSDFAHLTYSLPMVYIASSYIVLKHVVSKKVFIKHFHRPIKIILICSITANIVYFSRNIFKEEIFKKNFPLGTEDKQWIPGDYVATINFLKNNLGKGEEFLTMTNEGVWYYFIDRPCPIRFPVIWFAAPEAYQKEVIMGLEGKNVKYILYKNKNQACDPGDGIMVIDKLPIIKSFIESNYAKYCVIDDNEVWIKKQRKQSHSNQPQIQDNTILPIIHGK